MWRQAKLSMGAFALGLGLLGLGACTDTEDASDAGPLAGQSAQTAGSSGADEAGGTSAGGAAGSETAGRGGATNAEDAATASPDGGSATDDDAEASSDAGSATTADAGAVSAELSAEERASLLFMREEEKLARDVYMQLQSRDRVFENIVASEQMHMDAVATLLERYALPDPAEGKAVGQFSDGALQALYEQLVQDAGTSLITALQVGLEIEELDLRDLERASEDVTHADIEGVFAQLTRGSRNHLRAFYARLSSLGGTYTPKYLDAASFDAIATSSRETGP